MALVLRCVTVAEKPDCVDMPSSYDTKGAPPKKHGIRKHEITRGENLSEMFHDAGLRHCHGGCLRNSWPRLRRDQHESTLLAADVPHHDASKAAGAAWRRRWIGRGGGLGKVWAVQHEQQHVIMLAIDIR